MTFQYKIHIDCFAQSPKHAGQLAKFTSHMYKCLAAEEKAKWEAHASQDKSRFEAEMASYVPPPGYDQAGNLMEDHRRVINKKYQKKAKDPEQPKVRTALVRLQSLFGVSG